jgi:hypothetical protein
MSHELFQPTKLTHKERLYVEARLGGMSRVAAATAAGYANPGKEGSIIDAKEHIQAAMVDAMQKSSEEVGFGRREAHDMYMQAYMNADTAAEQIAAVNAMVKLHGLEAPRVLEVKHEHKHEGSLQLMPTDELMKLAGMDKALALEGEFEQVGEKDLLEAPPTNENTADSQKALPAVQSDY